MSLRQKSPSNESNKNRALPVNGAEVNDISYIFDVMSMVQDDSAEVKALLAEQQRFIERYSPIKKYVFADVDEKFSDAAYPLASISGMTPQAYRIESLSDPAPDEDIREMIMALVGGVDHSFFRGGAEPDPTHAPFSYQRGDNELVETEIVIDKNGQPRQAGATMPEGEYIKRFKRRAEESLFIFAKGILGRHFLTKHFHRDVCNWLQKCAPFRKLLLMPREHAKTTIVSGALPPHILIQSAETNIYFPGLEGSECRILLSGETAVMAEKNLRVIQGIFEENRVFRAFWPHRVWEGKAKSDSRMWNNQGMIIPRDNEWPDPTIRAVGVGGAVTGSRPNVLIKDDLTTFAAANSDVVMDEAIEWHKVSRALLDKYEVESGLQSLEFIAATRWAVYDLCSYIIDKDPSVEVSDESVRKIINDGNILWPEKYTLADIQQLQREHGSNFYLLYLNTPADPSLVDFDMEQIRIFRILNGQILFEGDERDLLLDKNLKIRKAAMTAQKPPANIKRGTALTSSVMQRMIDGGGGMRLRAA